MIEINICHSDKWKASYIFSIYKKRNKWKCENVSPGIPVSSTMSRSYERIPQDLIED